MKDRAHVDMIEFQINAPSINTPVGNLSGGNVQRVILAREFHLSTKVLLANQPTRGLDIGVIEYIYKRLLEKRAEGVAIILAAMVGGGALSAFSGWLKSRFEVNAIISTVMMNYVIVYLLSYLLAGGPWTDCACRSVRDFWCQLPPTR